MEDNGTNAHAEVARNLPRDEHGHFLHPDQASLPTPLEITHTDQYHKVDPPLVALSVTNPVTYLKLFLKKLLGNEGIDIHLKIKPLTAIFMVTMVAVSGRVGYSLGVNQIASTFFPNSSPILHRQIAYQGVLERTELNVYYLRLPDNSLYKLKFSSSSPNLPDWVNETVLVKGNLEREPNVIDVADVALFQKP